MPNGRCKTAECAESQAQIVVRVFDCCAALTRTACRAGKFLDFDKVDPVVKKALKGVPKAPQKLMERKMPTLFALMWSRAVKVSLDTRRNARISGDLLLGQPIQLM